MPDNLTGAYEWLSISSSWATGGSRSSA